MQFSTKFLKCCQILVNYSKKFKLVTIQIVRKLQARQRAHNLNEPVSTLLHPPETPNRKNSHVMWLREDTKSNGFLCMEKTSFTYINAMYIFILLNCFL